LTCPAGRLADRPARVALIGLALFITPAGCGEKPAARLSESPQETESPQPASSTPRPIDQLRQARIDTFSNQELDHYLNWLAAEPLDLRSRVILLARQSVGQRYQLFVLGEFPFELTDPDPLYNLRASDCVTFVEQTYAMALSQNWPSFFKTLQRIRYRDGIIGFETRNHFTEADWNVNNAWLFSDVSAALAPKAAEPMKSSIDRAAFFKKAGIDRHDPIQIVEGSYIPRGPIESILPLLQDGDVIEFVREGGGYKSVTHLGLIAHDAHGGVTLIHSGKPAVQELPLADYLTRRPAFCGIKVLRARAKAL
jgi:Protein of unknown function (DUF1460)